MQIIPNCQYCAIAGGPSKSKVALGSVIYSDGWKEIWRPGGLELQEASLRWISNGRNGIHETQGCINSIKRLLGHRPKMKLAEDFDDDLSPRHAPPAPVKNVSFASIIS